MKRRNKKRIMSRVMTCLLFVAIAGATGLFLLGGAQPAAAQSFTNEVKITANDGTAGDFFGGSVSISGDYAIVGAPYDDDYGNSSGSAYIFKRDGTGWTKEAKLVPDDGAAGDYFGRSVSIFGDYAIVGAHDDYGNSSGSAYIFKRDGTGWTQEAKLIPDDGAAGDSFGGSVAISDEYAIIGAFGDDGLVGSAYIFTRNGNSWTQQAKLTASDGAGGIYFGYSVSLSGDYAIVGAPRYIWAASGLAYIFKRDGTSWTQQAKLTAIGGSVGDCFGETVSIFDEYAIVGAPNDDDNGNDSGSAYIFKRDGSSWTQQAKLIASDGAAGDYFGRSVSISGDYAIVGAPDDNYGNSSGSAYIFKRGGSSWTQQTKLTASDGAAGDYFGRSVSISGDYTIVGAPNDDDNGNNSGSAYIYDLCAEAPQISSISPTQVEASTFELTINGSNFDSGAVDQIYWKADGHFVGQGTVLSRSSTQLVVREEMEGASSGTYQIEVMNSDGQRSNRVDLVIITSFDYPVSKEEYIPGSYGGRSFYYDSVHLGEDIRLPAGTPISAIADGTIVQYEFHSGYATEDDGTSIAAVIEHDLGRTVNLSLQVGHKKDVSVDKICSIYGHIRKSKEYDGAKLAWKVGDEVKKGEIIGYINDDDHNGDGSEHLHLGIRITEHPGYWVYFGYENVGEYPESNVKYFAAASEIIEKLNANPILITPNGGIASLPDGSASVFFPPEAIPEDTFVYITITMVDEVYVPPPSEGWQLLGDAYDFSAVDAEGNPITEFDKTLEVTIQYDPNDLNGLDEGSLTLHYYDLLAGIWMPLSSIVDPWNNTVTGETDHFSIFAIFGIPEPSTLLLFGTGLIGILVLARRKLKKK